MHLSAPKTGASREGLAAFWIREAALGFSAAKPAARSDEARWSQLAISGYCQRRTTVHWASCGHLAWQRVAQAHRKIVRARPEVDAARVAFVLGFAIADVDSGKADTHEFFRFVSELSDGMRPV